MKLVKANVVKYNSRGEVFYFKSSNMKTETQ